MSETKRIEKEADKMYNDVAYEAKTGFSFVAKS